MGKVQSKGDCFVVNAHFNPVCHQLDEISRTTVSSNDIQQSKTNRSTIGLSKMSLSISRDNIIMNQKVGNDKEKYPLRVLLPQETSSPSLKMSKNFNLGLHKEDDEDEDEEDDQLGRPEKAEEEKSEKEEKQSKLKKSGGKISCDVSVDDLEKQEFSFTLYDFNGHGKVTKDDVAGLVRSIYEALGRSVKLPPSGSRTIKVHLAVSPDSPTTNLDIPDCVESQADMLSVNKGQTGIKDCSFMSATATNANCQESNLAGSEPSVHTLSTYISSTVEKIVNSETPPNCPHGCASRNFKLHLQPPPSIQPPNPPIQDTPVKKHPVENLLSKETYKDGCRERILFKRIPDTHNEPKDPTVQHRHRHHHRHQYGAGGGGGATTNRDHVTECRERRNHYLDLVGIESCGGHHPKMVDSFSNSPYAIPVSHQPIGPQPNSNYACPCRIIDRPVHNQCRVGASGGFNFPNGQHHECLPEPKRFEHHPSPFVKYQIYKNSRQQSQQDDLLNVNFDLCDLAPNEKFDWEYIHQHRRSKSYDIYDKKLENHLGSPRTKQKLFKPAGQFLNSSLTATKQEQTRGVPSSPNHHYRHRHREREHQRAMQQVANWIEKEHLGGMDPDEELNPSKPTRKSPLVVERHEHHHLHEHVHHHYHHYVEN